LRGYCNDKRQSFLDYERYAVGKTRQIDAPVTPGTEPPEKWMLNDGGTGALNFGAKSRTKAFAAGLIVAGDAFKLGSGLWKEFQDEAHYALGSLVGA
jgi:hypothetical protein